MINGGSYGGNLNLNVSPVPEPETWSLAVAGLAQWLANFLITWTFPMLLGSALGLSGAYGIYMLCSLLSIFFVVWCVRETKGVELEKMAG